MESWTQTSNCGCSRKNSVVSTSAKRHHQHHHQHNNTTNHHHHSSSLRRLQPVELDVGGDSSSLSLASLRIKAVRAPTIITSSAPSDFSLNENLVQGNSSDYPHGERAAAEIASDYTAVARGGVPGTDSDDYGVGFPSELRGQSRDGVYAASVRETGSSYVYATSPPGAASDAAARRSGLTTESDVGDCLRRGDAMPRAVNDIVTHGHFVSRRPVPGARRCMTDIPQRQQQHRAGRERCRSGAPASAVGTEDARKGWSATRSRRGKSAGEKYCGRPCDACSLQQFQNWVKGKQLQEFANGENQERMFIMDTKGWRRVAGPAGFPITTVSVPGQGLPKLTGLKHELVDPGYYDRHREDVVNSHKPDREWLQTRKDSEPVAGISMSAKKHVRPAEAKLRRGPQKLRAELLRKFSKPETTTSSGERVQSRRWSEKRDLFQVQDVRPAWKLSKAGRKFSSKRASAVEGEADRDGETTGRRKTSITDGKTRKDSHRRTSAAGGAVEEEGSEKAEKLKTRRSSKRALSAAESISEEEDETADRQQTSQRSKRHARKAERRAASKSDESPESPAPYLPKESPEYSKEVWESFDISSSSHELQQVAEDEDRRQQGRSTSEEDEQDLERKRSLSNFLTKHLPQKQLRQYSSEVLHNVLKIRRSLHRCVTDQPSEQTENEAELSGESQILGESVSETENVMLSLSRSSHRGKLILGKVHSGLLKPPKSVSESLDTVMAIKSYAQKAPSGSTMDEPKPAETIPMKRAPAPCRLLLGDLMTVMSYRGRKTSVASVTNRGRKQSVGKQKGKLGTGKVKGQPAQGQRRKKTEDAAQKLQVTTAEPPVTAKGPPVLSEEPSVRDAEPLVTAEDLLMIDAEPPVIAAEPEVTAAEHSVTAEEPPVTTEEPPVTAEETPVTAAEVSVTAAEPLVTGKEPPVTAEEPLVTAGEPLVTTGEPSMTAEEPLVTGDTPAVAEEKTHITMLTPSVTREGSTESIELSVDVLLQHLTEPSTGDLLPRTLIPSTAQETEETAPEWLPVLHGQHIMGLVSEISPSTGPPSRPSSGRKMTEKQPLGALLPTVRPDTEVSLSITSTEAAEGPSKHCRARGESTGVTLLRKQIASGREMRYPADLSFRSILGTGLKTASSGRVCPVPSAEFLQQMQESIHKDLKESSESGSSWYDGMPMLLSPSEVRGRRVPPTPARSGLFVKVTPTSECTLGLDKARFDEDSHLALLREQAHTENLERFQKIKKGRSGLKSQADAESRATTASGAGSRVQLQPTVLNSSESQTRVRVFEQPGQLPVAPSPTTTAVPEGAAARPEGAASDARTDLSPSQEEATPSRSVEPDRREDEQVPREGKTPPPTLKSERESEKQAENPMHRLFGHLYKKPPSPAMSRVRSERSVEHLQQWLISPVGSCLPQPGPPSYPPSAAVSGLQLPATVLCAPFDPYLPGPAVCTLVAGLKLTTPSARIPPAAPQPAGPQLPGSPVRPPVSAGPQLPGLPVRPPVSAGPLLPGPPVRPPVSAGPLLPGPPVRPPPAGGPQLPGPSVRYPTSAGPQLPGPPVRPPVSAGPLLPGPPVGPPPAGSPQLPGPSVRYPTSAGPQLPGPPVRPPVSAGPPLPGPPVRPPPAGGPQLPGPPVRPLPSAGPQLPGPPVRPRPSAGPQMSGPTARSLALASRPPPFVHAVPVMQRYYSKCPYFRRTHRGLADGDPWLATVSSLRISPSVGMVRSCPLAGCTLLEMLSRPEDFVSDVKAGQTTPKDEEQGSVEQSHFASTAGLLVGHGLGTVLGRQAGERRRKDRACFVTAFGWFSSAEYDAVRRCRVVPGGAAAPSYYLASPYVDDRFFVENKRSMRTLNVKAPPKDERFLPHLMRRKLPPELIRQYPLGVYPTVAEMQTYERLRQRVHKQSRQEARQAVTGKPASVLSSPVMQRHLRRGRKLMKEHESEIRLQEDAFDDLLENILLYDVPGVSKMQDDYTVLLKRPASGKADRTRQVPDDVSDNASINVNNIHSPSLQPQQASNTCLPSFIAGQRS